MEKKYFLISAQMKWNARKFGPRKSKHDEKHTVHLSKESQKFMRLGNCGSCFRIQLNLSPAVGAYTLSVKKAPIIIVGKNENVQKF